MMGMDISVNMVFAASNDGVFKPIGFTDVKEIADDEVQNNENIVSRINTDRDISHSFTIRKPQLKRLMRILYGWKAKGPIRRGVLNKYLERRSGMDI